MRKARMLEEIRRNTPAKTPSPAMVGVCSLTNYFPIHLPLDNRSTICRVRRRRVPLSKGQGISQGRYAP